MKTHVRARCNISPHFPHLAIFGVTQPKTMTELEEGGEGVKVGDGVSFGGRRRPGDNI